MKIEKAAKICRDEAHKLKEKAKDGQKLNQYEITGLIEGIAIVVEMMAKKIESEKPKTENRSDRD